MVKIITIIFAFLIFTKQSNIDNKKCNIVSKWIFNGIYKPENISIRKKEILEEIFNEIEIEFHENGNYKFYLEEKDKGNYTYNCETYELVLKSDKNEKNILKFECLTDTSAVLSFSENKSIIVKRSPLIVSK